MKLPANNCQRIFYFVFFPLMSLQYITIPNPMLPGKDNFYPLTLVMAIIWVWFYCYLIVWWTYVVTMAYNLHFSILPMVVYPFGIALRDTKKFYDLRDCLDKFKTKMRDQKLSLAETYSGQVFQITGLMGFAWIMYISLTEKSVSFINEGIQYQMPLLILVIIVKYVILVIRKFKSSRKFFYINLAGYTIFLLIVILLDYRIEFFGE
jgi:Ca2+/Na+ antiporter